MELNEFHEKVGEIMEFCQCIEENIRRIYACMQDGGYEKNLLKMESERWTLGQTITELKKYDESWDEPLFSPEEYRVLFDLTRLRNYYAHKVFLTFYDLGSEEDFDYSYGRASYDLEKDLEIIARLYEKSEDVRIDYLDKAGIRRKRF